MEVENNLKALRLKKNVSQERVAQAVNITRGSYSLYECGKRSPDIHTVLQLATFYDVPVECVYSAVKKSESTVDRYFEASANVKRIVTIYRSLGELAQGRLMERAEILWDEQAAKAAGRNSNS